MGFFHYQAHIIQKNFRGYYSRRYYHDFFARKAYINSIMNKSEALKQQLQEHREKLEKIQAAQRENDAREEKAEKKAEKAGKARQQVSFLSRHLFGRAAT